MTAFKYFANILDRFHQLIKSWTCQPRLLLSMREAQKAFWGRCIIVSHCITKQICIGTKVRHSKTRLPIGYSENLIHCVLPFQWVLTVITNHLNILIEVEYEGGGGEEGDAEQGAGRLHGGLPIKGTLKVAHKSFLETLHREVLIF